MKKMLFFIVILYFLFIPFVLSQNSNIPNQNITKEDIQVPENIKKLSNSLFNLNNEDVSLEKLILLCALFLILIIMLFEIFKIMPLLSNSFLRVLGAIIVTILASISGGVNKSVFLFLFWANSFNFSRSGAAKITIFIIVSIILIIIVAKFSDYFKAKMVLDKAEELGEKLRQGKESAEIFNNATRALAKAKREAD